MHIYALAIGPRNPFRAIAVPNVMAYFSPSHTPTAMKGVGGDQGADNRVRGPYASAGRLRACAKGYTR